MVGQSETSQGFGYHGPGGEVRASDYAVDKITASFERIAHEAFRWSSQNPSEFFAVLLLIAFALYLRHRKRVQIARMKLEFKERREAVRQSVPTQLPMFGPQAEDQ